MRFSLKTVVCYSLVLIVIFLIWHYSSQLKTSMLVWGKGGLALSEEVLRQLRSLWDLVGKYINWIIGFYSLIAFLVVLMEEQNPDKANLWLFTLLLFPFVGLAAYMFFGPNAKSVPHRMRMQKLSKKSLQSDKKDGLRKRVEPGLERLLAVSCGSVPTFQNKVEVLLDGEETFNAIEAALKEACDYIHMEYFSVASDELGRRIGECLKERAGAGVKVRFMYDSVGSWSIGRDFVAELKEAGIEVQAFMPMAFARFRSGLNHRDHRKIIVIDGKIGFLGGLNIGDMYMGKDPKMGRWRDTHISIRGTAVYELNQIFLTMWERCSGVKPYELYCPSMPPPAGADTPVQIAESGPGQNFRGIADAYFHMISNAKNRVWITTPYLVPGEALSQALCVAARSGVDVRIIIPSKADHRLVFWASQFNVDQLLRHGVRIFSYKDGFIHAKTMVVDTQIVSVGTTNLDMRSLEVNYEVQAFIQSSELAERFESDFLNDLGSCDEETVISRQGHSIIQKLQNSIGRLWTALL